MQADANGETYHKYTENCPEGKHAYQHLVDAVWVKFAWVLSSNWAQQKAQYVVQYSTSSRAVYTAGTQQLF